MANEHQQAILDRILAGLKSDDTTQQLAAIHELETINFSSAAIVLELEQLALHGVDAVQKFALGALTYENNQFVASQLSTLSKSNRQSILEQIEAWVDDGLIELQHAEILKRRYDFDLHPSLPAKPTVAEPDIANAEKPAPIEPTESVTPARPPEPPRSLAQVLLSETSIRIYLYLGAFFVVASAAILAALVEAARLPILLIATVAFAGGALGLKQRLPQPSFAFAIVFSFLLPIDANVFKETLHLSEPYLSLYCSCIFLVMAVIWAFSTWFYTSSFFSVAAFTAMSLAFNRAAEIFNTELELQVLFMMIAALVGLAGVFLLKRWQSQKFALPIFLLAQAQVLALLLVSLSLAISHALDANIANGWWLIISLTWMAAAAFFATSDLLIPFLFFPWTAVGSLLLLPWFFLSTFAASQQTYSLGFWLWAAIFAATSEAVFRFPKTQKYGWAFLAGSLPLFFTALLIAVDLDKRPLTFMLLTGTALVYTALHVVRPRWYVWSTALISLLVAYFVFFRLPAVEPWAFPLLYQVLIATLCFSVPELFASLPLTSRSQSRLPTLVFGIFLSTACLTLALADGFHPGQVAVVFITFATLFTLHAFHFKHPWISYLATASTVAAIPYFLESIHRDAWLPTLSGLALIYYFGGFSLRRFTTTWQTWGSVLLNSGLILGALISILAIAVEKQSSGWYMILIAVIFALEIFARPFAWLEMAVEFLLSLALLRILLDFNPAHVLEHSLFGTTLIWLGGDLIFSRLLDQRVYRLIPIGIGFGLLAGTTFFLFQSGSNALALTYYLIYAAFFVVYTLSQHEPRLGYVTTTFGLLALLQWIDLMNIERWAFPLIGLSVLYYLPGFVFRYMNIAKGWDTTLLYSGMTLGVLTSVAAPLQTGGIEKALPIAIAATLFAIEAFARRNVWWALPANGLYLIAYFVILNELHVDEPQYYAIGASLLGMLMHYLLTRAGSKTGAFTMGMLSQLVLLGTTYLQMVALLKLNFFFVLFVQSLIILAYGILMRSRSLVIAPISFAVLGVATILYYALRNLSLVVIIGFTGITLLSLGILAVVMRERITTLAERFSDWNA